ncbi:MAG: tyrosine-type recombinase/integrase [Anaerolineae bacterium]
MYNAIVAQPNSTSAVAQQFADQFGGRWIEIFDPLDAVEAVFQHVETLASSRTTRHTARQYRICLYDYLAFCGAVIEQDQTDKTRIDGDIFDFSAMGIHTSQQMKDYISYCLRENRTSKTIKKYLAPVRLYLEALRKKPFFGVTGDVRFIIEDAKQLFEMAADVDAPPEVYKSSQSAGQRGVRLNLTQVKEYIAQIERDTLKGKRDLALFYVGLVSMLRVSEIQRMRLCDIRIGSKSPYEITVIGKRNNVDPVGLDQAGYALILDWVEAYNAGLDHDDERRITADKPIWQSLRHGDNYEAVGVNGFDPAKGMSANAIRKMLDQRTPDVVREQIGNRGLKPHDLRRTTALALAEQNVPIPAIQRQLRHSNAQTTSNYIGEFVDLGRGLISNYWQLEVAS